jgi:hypothetical protein
LIYKGLGRFIALILSDEKSSLGHSSDTFRAYPPRLFIFGELACLSFNTPIPAVGDATGRGADPLSELILLMCGCEFFFNSAGRN